MNNVENLKSGDVIRDSVLTAVNTVVRSMEPQLNELASRVTDQAIEKSRHLTRAAIREVRRQPWYLVGAAAILLVGAAVMIGFEMSGEMDSQRGISPGANI